MVLSSLKRGTENEPELEGMNGMTNYNNRSNPFFRPPEGAEKAFVLSFLGGLAISAVLIMISFLVVMAFAGYLLDGILFLGMILIPAALIIGGPIALVMIVGGIADHREEVARRERIKISEQKRAKLEEKHDREWEERRKRYQMEREEKERKKKEIWENMTEWDRTWVRLMSNPHSNVRLILIDGDRREKLTQSQRRWAELEGWI